MTGKPLHRVNVLALLSGFAWLCTCGAGSDSEKLYASREDAERDAAAHRREVDQRS